ncbi:stage V sporulation protein E [Caloranaerobacter azorensis H53214]|uniref:Probable peptidoglycan glycosyltransferase FtsW n=1 Tax=Caloranaerobacter azorensis H53214 TaxID=1156417 RepID=A0A096BI98_9FIRM|nr:stage V sporulation protein E [Caloranaerobacter azorensis]KGG80567.1 stage V sporulation protein E [Caloranaerobacter azorensis H53214]
MIKKKACDFTLMIVTILLVFIGIIMVFSSSYPEAYYKMKDGYFFLKKQMFFSALGLFAMIFFMNFDYWRFQKLSKLIFLISIILGLLIFTPLGTEFHGARRWINLGFTTFQPSEAIKLGSIIYLASYLSRKKERIKYFFKGVVPALIIIGIACGLIIIQKDLSTSATLGLTLMIMLFIAGMKFLHLTFLASIGIGGAVLAILKEEFRVKRILAFLDPFKYKDTVGWQLVQSLYALGSGGIFGLGLGKSRQKFFYIPEPYNDFIFAIIGEELGFVGCVTVIILFLILIWRGIRIAINAKDLFGCLLASGIVALITVQSMIHIAVVTSSIPPTGIPLPFVSFGGTSLLIFMSAVGILLNISRYTDLDRS